jgi:hypothetical protein
MIFTHDRDVAVQMNFALGSSPGMGGDGALCRLPRGGPQLHKVAPACRVHAVRYQASSSDPLNLRLTSALVSLEASIQPYHPVGLRYKHWRGVMASPKQEPLKPPPPRINENPLKPPDEKGPK